MEDEKHVIDEHEQHEAERLAGLEAYASAVAKLVASNGPELADPAQLELIKQGLMSSLRGPIPRPIQMSQMPVLLTDNSNLFEDDWVDKTVWYDFQALVKSALRITRMKSDGATELQYPSGLVLTIKGPAADAFHEWRQRLVDAIKTPPSASVKPFSRF